MWWDHRIGHIGHGQRLAKLSVNGGFHRTLPKIGARQNSKPSASQLIPECAQNCRKPGLARSGNLGV